MFQLKQKSNYFEKINPEDVWIFPKISSQKQRRHYVEQSLIHPAKMPTFFVQKIISDYSKPGDLILDPMAGIGTTLIEAMLLGRNAIGVEYEEKFCSIIERNIKNINAFRQIGSRPLGHTVILQGDSRQLSKVLKENAGKIDAVVCSPPYSSALKGEIDGKDWAEKMEKFGSTPDSRRNRKTPGRLRAADVQGEGYSKDKTNIGNLHHGEIDVVVTSPPFSEMQKDKGGGINNQRKGDLKIGCANPTKDYSKKNISRLKHSNIGTMLSKETYLDAMLKVYKECFTVLKQGGLMALVTKNFVRKGEMVRLDLDTIKLCKAAGFSFKERKYRKLDSVSFWIRNAKKKWYKANPSKTSGDPYADYEDVLVFEKKNKGVFST